MTMHLVRGVTTTVTKRKQKRTNNKRLAAANNEHDKWLRKQGLHTEQLKDKPKPKNEIPSYDVSKEDLPEMGNGIAGHDGMAAKLDIWEVLRKGGENPDTVKRIKELANRTMPLYNKGPYQLATPDTDLTQVGSKSRRG